MNLIVRNGSVLLGAYAAFAVVHSLLAGLRLKLQLKPLLGDRVVEGWYRLAYNMFSVVTFAPIVLLIILLPDTLIYQVKQPWSIILRCLQGLGIVGLIGALFVTDIWQFSGLKQAVAYINRDPLPMPASPLQETGMYRFVRHPLYFFSFLVVWATPMLSVNGFWFNIATTLYFVVGSLIEERRMLDVYGDIYRKYRARVSWLIPWFPSSKFEDGAQDSGEVR